MPKFRFEFIDFAKTETLEVELADQDAALQQAQMEAREALVDGAIEGVDRTGSVTKVYDEAGILVCTVNFADFMDGVASTQPPAINTIETDNEEPGVMRSG